MNKRLFILIICISNLASSIQAQTGTNQIGIKAGDKRSNVYGKSGEEFITGIIYGYAFGRFVSLPIDGFIGVQPESIYSQKDFKANSRLIGRVYSFTRTNRFMAVPIHLQLKMGTMFSFLIGPQFSFLNQTIDGYNEASISITQLKEITNVNIKKIIPGATLGFDDYVNQLLISATVDSHLQKNKENVTSYKPRYSKDEEQLIMGAML